MNTRLFLTAIFFILTTVNMAGQTFDLDFELVSVTTTDYQVKVKIRGSSSFELGSSNIRFNFNNTDLQTPILVSAHNFNSNPYMPMTVTESVAGVASINITNIFQSGTPVLTTPGWTDIATVGFSIINVSGQSNLSFRSTSAPVPATVVYRLNPMQQLASNQLGVLNTSPLPVELLSFSAYNQEDHVHLHWETATELNNFGFEVERREKGREWKTVGFVPGHGTRFYPQIYDWDDMLEGLEVPLSQQQSITYRLKQVDRDGSFEYSPLVEVAFKPVPGSMVIDVYPNPMYERAAVSVMLEESRAVDIGVYDINGRLIRRIASARELEAGSHAFDFDARELPSGIYSVRVSDNSSAVMKAIIVRK